MPTVADPEARFCTNEPENGKNASNNNAVAATIGTGGTTGILKAAPTSASPRHPSRRRG
ncbi:hypothetical protein [Geminicoccus harenae]|uniref:hypothetical protein n=1 Tax=Geminicoccus harenae TaxID=2498453 RepID=UPI001C95BFF2|nr:hypothetical protein [Geminicoccus harenae]